MNAKQLSDLRVVGISFAVSISDVVLNLIVAIITGSTTMLSQALQGMSDLITAGALFLGVRRSSRLADNKHQFGYGREVFFWVLIASIIMFLGTGGISVFLGYKQIVTPGVLDFTGVAIAMLIFGLVTNVYAFSKSVKKLNQIEGKLPWWRRISRSSMVDIKATFLIDLLGSCAALFGLIAIGLFAITGNVQFDGLGSVVIGLSMMCGSILLIADVKGLIVGRSASEETLQKIRQAALRNAKVSKVLDLRTMFLGSSRLLIVVEVHLDDRLTTDEIEKVIDDIKDHIHDEIPNATLVQIEVETPDEELTKKYL